MMTKTVDSKLVALVWGVTALTMLAVIFAAAPRANADEACGDGYTLTHVPGFGDQCVQNPPTPTQLPPVQFGCSGTARGTITLPPASVCPTCACDNVAFFGPATGDDARVLPPLYPYDQEQLQIWADDAYGIDAKTNAHYEGSWWNRYYEQRSYGVQ